jgi:hypothetical protein
MTDKSPRASKLLFSSLTSAIDSFGLTEHDERTKFSIFAYPTMIESSIPRLTINLSLIIKGVQTHEPQTKTERCLTSIPSMASHLDNHVTVYESEHLCN